MKKLILLFTICVATVSYAQKMPQGVSVEGEGTVRVVPDQVLINVRAEHEGNSATEVKELTDSDINEVIKFLKSKGIKSKNIQTEYIQLGKSYNYQTKKYNYRSYQSLSVLLEDIEDYEMIMNGLMASGINNISNVNFQSSSADELEAEARKKAIENAKMKAQEYADALGQPLGEAYFVSEIQNQAYQPVMMNAKMDASAVESSSRETIAVGEMEITVKINVGFFLK